MKGSSSSLLLALTASLAAALQVTPVFTSYQVNQSECYRQPILLSLPGNRLVALVEGRSGISWCAGTDWPVAPSFPIVSRASNDGGATWGDIATVLPPANLDFLTSVFDPRTNKLHLMVQLGDDGIVYTTSTDFGRSWSPAVPIFVAGTFASIIPGVGHGIVIDPKYCIDPSCGGTAGRLIMSFACTLAGPVSNDTYCVYCRTCLLTSDNGGGSWALSAVSNHTGSREAALAQLNSADYFTTGAVVYVSERNLGPTPGSRMHAVSLNGGSTFDARYYGVDASLPDVLTGWCIYVVDRWYALLPDALTGEGHCVSIYCALL